MADRGDLEDAVAAGFQLRTHQFGQLGSLGHVGLVERDQPRAGQQVTERALVLAQFGFDGVEVRQRVAARVEGCAVEHVQ